MECVCRVEKEKRMKHYVRFLFFLENHRSFSFFDVSLKNLVQPERTQTTHPTKRWNTRRFFFLSKKKNVKGVLSCARLFSLIITVIIIISYIHIKSVLTLVLLLTTSFSVDFDSEIVSGTLPLMTTFFWSIFVSPTSYFFFVFVIFSLSLSLSLSLDW